MPLHWTNGSDAGLADFGDCKNLTHLSCGESAWEGSHQGGGESGGTLAMDPLVFSVQKM